MNVKEIDEYIFTSSVTSIDKNLENENKEKLTLFPNPVKNILSTNFSISNNAYISNSLGVKVKLLFNNHDINKIDVSDLSNGIYTFIDEKNSFKFVKID